MYCNTNTLHGCSFSTFSFLFVLFNMAIYIPHETLTTEPSLVHVFLHCPKLPAYTTIMPSLSSSSSSTCTFLLSFLFALTASNCAAKEISSTSSPRQLSVDYYAKTCPQLEQLVGSVTSQQFKEAPVSGPATIRLFFHDCFVQVNLIPFSALSLPCMLYVLAYYFGTFFVACTATHRAF